MTNGSNELNPVGRRATATVAHSMVRTELEQRAPRALGLVYGLVALTLIVLVGYTYGLFVALPYAGWDGVSSDGKIQYVWRTDTGLLEGDRLLAVDGRAVSAFRRDLRQPFWPPSPPETATYTIERGGQTLDLTVLLSRFTPREFEERLLSQWFLAWAFALAGLAIALIVRPRDTRWWLLVAFHALTALWLSASSLSRWHAWESMLLLHATIWASVPVNWHLHWIFPTPLTRVPRVVWIGAYGLAALLVLAEVLQIVPASTYNIGFLLALCGVLVPWIVRAVRRQIPSGARLMLIAVGAAIVPSLLFSSLYWTERPVLAAGLGLLALPILPAAYVFMASRRQLDGMELWANRALAAYLYALGTMFLAALMAMLVWQLAADSSIVLGAAVGMTAIVAVLTPSLFPPVQRWIERHVLGLPWDRDRLLEGYLVQIVASTDLSSLVHTLRDQILPSLLVRQSALYQINEVQAPELIYCQGVAKDALLDQRTLSNWSHDPSVPQGWVRLVLPLKLDGDPVGFLLLGAHDPDDVYTASERTLLRILADQTAIALAHARRTEQLRLLFQANIERHEAERAALARDLHDDILQQMAVLATHALNPAGEAAYASIVSHTRQMISGLRPVMLDYGLAVALEQLADDLADRAGPGIDLRVSISGEARYATLVEQHVYRIVQQAAENALKHAQGSWIEISGALGSESLSLWVTDNGVGIRPELTTALGPLIAQRHFGLAGMVERATLIGAALQVRALPQGGSTVGVEWAKDNPPRGN